MPRKIWRKLGLVAMSSGMVFGGLGCIGLDNDLVRSFLQFVVNSTVFDAVGGAGILGTLTGGA